MSEIDAIPAPDSAAHVGCAASDCSRGEPMPDVPFDSLPTQKVTLRDGIGVVIPSGATLQVWQVEERDGFQIKIRRPLDDGTRSLLKFGLSRDAAIALHGLLQMQLYPENVEVTQGCKPLSPPSCSASVGSGGVFIEFAIKVPSGTGSTISEITPQQVPPHIWKQVAAIVSYYGEQSQIHLDSSPVSHNQGNQ